MPFHRLPGAPGGDTHFLVVVALTAPGGKGIAQPEVVLCRQCVGDIGKRGCALVGGDHQIGVITVIANDIGRRDYLAVIKVISDIQQPPYEGLIAGNPFFANGLPRAIPGRLLHHEATLRACRHDHRVLDLLGLHQAKDLRTVILNPVGPAKATPRDWPGTQMHAFDSGRIHKNLELWPWARYVRNRRRIQLERQIGRKPAILPDLEIVGSQRCPNEHEETPQNAVVIEARHRFQRIPQLCLKLFCPGLTSFYPGLEPIEKERHEPRSDIRMPGQGFCNERLAEPESQLFHVTGIGSDQRHFPPAQAAEHDQLVEIVVFCKAVPDLPERRLDQRPCSSQVGLPAPVVEFDGKITDAEIFAIPSTNPVWVLAQNPHTQVLQNRNHI